MTSMKRSDPIIDWQLLAKTIHTGIVDLKKEDRFTDFVVDVGEKSFHCHQVVLASVSDYFKAMFCSGMKETVMRKAVLDDVNPDSFHTIMKILYPEGKVNPLENSSEAEMSDLLKLARRLHIPFLQKTCLKYFNGTMATGNCVMRLKLGKDIMCEELTDFGFRFIEKHFEEMSIGSDLVSMEFDDFLTIIKSRSLRVKDEIMWSAIRNWVDFDREKRQINIDELMRECCLTEVDPDVLMDEIVFDPLIRQSDTTFRLLQDAVKYTRHPGTHGDIELKFRECHEKEQVTLLLLRKDKPAKKVTKTRENVKGVLISYDDTRRITKNIGLFDDIESCSTWGLQCCVHGQSVYGLIDKGPGHFSSLWEYIGSKNSWQFHTDMDTALVGHAMSAADGYIYAVSGRSSDYLTTVVWQYCLDDKSWDIDGEIKTAVACASSVCVSNKIYIFGGMLIEDNLATDIIQVYDTKKQKGAIFGRLPKPCDWSRAVVRGSTAYVVTSDGQVVSVSLETGVSAIIAAIPNFRRTSFGISLQCNELYIFGGNKNVRDIKDKGKLGTVVKMDNSAKGNFVVNVITGDLKSSKLFNEADCEVLASVSVVVKRLPRPK